MSENNALFEVGSLQLLGLNQVVISDNEIWCAHCFATLRSFLVELLSVLVDVNVGFGDI